MKYGFWFWLRWIVWFAGSFVLAAIFWTTVMSTVFGKIAGTELTITWCIAVFGSWFLLIIPFMRKKEQIWKRMNDDQEKAVDAWFLGMGVFIGLLLASAFLWAFILKERIESRPSGGFDPLWAKAVIASWLAILLPFLVFMYRKADSIFKAAEARQTYVPRFQSIYVDSSKRFLAASFIERLKGIPQVLRGGHVVTLSLKDGRKIPHVFVVNGREILGVYARNSFDFGASDITEIEGITASQLPAYEESLWLRLDGKS